MRQGNVVYKNELKVEEVRVLNTQQFIEQVSHAFYMYNEKNLIHKHPSIFIQGQPGVGKSQSIRKIASNLENTTNKKVVITDVRLLLFNPIDLRGIPVADMKEKVAIWLRPQIFDLSSKQDVINILFLDELTAAPSSIQAAAYQIALDRKLGEHSLPQNTFIIAAGNRESDNAVTYEMPSPLKNRFMHFELKPNFETWLTWANEAMIHPEVINFLKVHPNHFATNDFDILSNIIITPRSWEMLSDVLYMFNKDYKAQEHYIASIIGNSLTYLFLNKLACKSIEDIVDGNYGERPKSMSELHRVVELLDNRIDYYIDDKEKTEHVLKLMNELPIDFGLKIFKKIIERDIEIYDITKIDAYQEYVKKIGELDESNTN
ncbi:MAG: AAA family ATPase [Acholeplasmataceae bacterium]|nr:AAA family ATPase [Acholeplasmataceae bacterium]